MLQETVQDLQENSIVLKIKHQDETLLLMCLRLRCSDSCIMRILQNKQNINATNRQGKTALHMAVQRQTITIAKELIKKGALINAQNKNKFTPLHYAAAVGNHEALCMLLYYGVDVHVRTNLNLSPLTLAFFNKNFDSAKILINYYEEEDLFEEINLFYENYTSALQPLLELNSPDLFKSIWSMIDHKQLLTFKVPFLLNYLISCNFQGNDWLECLQLILQSYSGFELVDHCNRYMYVEYGYTFITLVLFHLHKKAIKTDNRLKTIYMIFSLGNRIHINDFCTVFGFYKFGPELEAFIYASYYDPMPKSDTGSFYYVVLSYILGFNNNFSGKTVLGLFERQMSYRADISEEKNEELILDALGFFSFTYQTKLELLKLCYNHMTYCDKIVRRLKVREEFPSLLELSRNQSYLYIKMACNVQKPYQLHDAIKNLGLPREVQDMLRFKKQIY